MPNLPSSKPWSINVNDAKTFYELALAQGLTATSQVHTNEKKNLSPDWTNVYQGGNDRFLYVEVPIVLKHLKIPVFRSKNAQVKATQMGSGVFHTLAVFKARDNGYRHRIITYAPDAEYLQSHASDLSYNRLGRIDNHFSGYVHYSNIHGVYIYSLRIEEGRAVKKLKIRKTGTENTRSSSGYYECYDVCTDWYEYICNEITVDYNAAGQPIQLEVCGWEYMFSECTTECTWIGDDDPCADPQGPSPECWDINPCEDDCEDHNGSGPEEQPDPVPDASTDPCARLQVLNTIKELRVIKEQNTLLRNSISTTQPLEYATEQTLMDWHSSNTNFTERPIRPGESANAVAVDFSWNATRGYTIGFSHTHPGGTGPSPDDVFALVDAVTHPDLLDEPDRNAAIAYFKKSAHITVITTKRIYAVYVDDWPGLASFANEWSGNADEMLDNFVTMVNDYQNYDRAFLEMFGPYVTLYKANNTGVFERQKLNDANQVVSNPCN